VGASDAWQRKSRCRPGWKPSVLRQNATHMQRATLTVSPCIPTMTTSPIKDKDIKRWNKERGEIDSELRASHLFFVSTISAVASRFYMPSGDELRQRFRMDMLVVGERSQATWPHIFMVWLTVDPEILFFAGDPKQLSPFARSDQAREILDEFPRSRSACWTILSSLYATGVLLGCRLMESIE
jgi:hypothetical protein